MCLPQCSIPSPHQHLGNQLVKYRQEGQSHFLFRLCDSSPPLRTKCPNISLTLHTRLVMTHTINKIEQKIKVDDNVRIYFIPFENIENE